MISKIQKYRRGYVAILPDELLKDYDIALGDSVEYTLEAGVDGGPPHMVIKRVLKAGNDQ